MKISALDFLRCPSCKCPLDLSPVVEEGRGEIRGGTLSCRQCGRSWPVRDGIVRFVGDAGDLDETKQGEVEGWKRHARQKTFPAHWDELLLKMPDVPPGDDPTGYWGQVAAAFPAAMALLAPLEGRRILEIGAAYGWASRRMSEAGAQVIASDINDDTVAGLGKADFYLDHGTPHFERVRCDAEHLPFPADFFDGVFCSSTIHHFQRPAILLREVARVLKPGATFIAIHEAFHPAWPARRPRWDALPGEVKQSIGLGINEQTFTHGSYRAFFAGAGLRFDAILLRWDAVRIEGGMVVKPNAALNRPEFRIPRLDRHSVGRLIQRLGLHKLLRLPPLAALARFIAFHYTGSYRILVGRKLGK